MTVRLWGFAAAAASLAAAARDCKQDELGIGSLPEWTYTYDATGPGRWAAMGGAYGGCAGDLQSPVALRRDDAVPGPPQFFHFWKKKDAHGAPPMLRHSRAGIELDVGGLGLMAVGSGFPRNMKLQKILLKNPSEHTLDGSRLDLERQMWFAPADDTHFANKTGHVTAASEEKSLLHHGLCGTELLVVSDLFRASDQLDPYLDQLRQYLTSFRDQELQEIAIPDILPDTYPAGDVYSYRGSVPFPPCTQAVQWMVSTEVLPITQAQLGLLRNPNATAGAFTTTYNNNRPPQPRNGRVIRRHRVFRPSRHDAFGELDVRKKTTPGAHAASVCPNTTGPAPAGAPPPMMPPVCGAPPIDAAVLNDTAAPPAPPTNTAMSDKNERLLLAALTLAVLWLVAVIFLIVVVSWSFDMPLINLPTRLRPHGPHVYAPPCEAEEVEEEEEDEEDEEGDEEDDDE